LAKNTSANAEKRQRFAAQAGMPPVPYDGMSHKNVVADNSGITFARPGRGSVGKRAGNVGGGFNLRGVIEVLTEFGLDPVAELAGALKKQKQVCERDEDGRLVPAKDAKGNPVYENALDEQIRVKVLMELTNFVHPKLKAVEMTVKKPELSEEQIDKRVAALVARMSKGALE
jgi:hypothetical protein